MEGYLEQYGAKQQGGSLLPPAMGSAGVQDQTGIRIKGRETTWVPTTVTANG